jgi:hypothetical protein
VENTQKDMQNIAMPADDLEDEPASYLTDWHKKKPK